MTRGIVAVVVVLVLTSVTATVPGAAAASQPQVTDVTYTGDGAVPGDRDALWLWQSEPHTFEATVESSEDVEGAELCLVARPPDGTAPQELACQPLDVQANETATASLSVEGLPANATGELELAVQLQSSDGSRVLNESAVSSRVLQKDADLDGDGLLNGEEAAAGSDLQVADTDGDGLEDGIEVNTYGTSPTNNDTDGDGLNDGAEVNEHDTDPTKPDTDGDGLADSQELEVGTNPNEPDTDGDGLDDAAEVNTYQTDPNEPDTDGDGLDDGAEVNEHETNPTKPDTDSDGLTDNLEVNTYGTNPRKIDTDGDGLNDGAEINQYGTDPTNADTDGDGLDDGAEINQYGTNPTKADTDGDGLNDGAEVNQYGTDPTNADTDGDGRNDAAEVRAAEERGVPLWVAGAVGVLVVAAAGGVLAYRSDRVSRGSLGSLLPWSPGGGDDPRGSSGAKRADGASATDDGNPDATSSGAELGPGAAATDAEADVPEDAPSSGVGEWSSVGDVPPEFLPDDERVLQILEQYDGRAQQSDIVSETGWSKAKTSRVLSKMDDYGKVVKIKVGRENLVARPDSVPAGVKPPEDE